MTEKIIISKAMKAFAQNFGVSRSDQEHFLCLNANSSVGLMSLKEAHTLLLSLIKKNKYHGIFLKDLEAYQKGKDFHYVHERVYAVLGTIMQLLKRHAIAVSVPEKIGPMFIFLNDIVFVIAPTQNVTEESKPLPQAYIV